MDCVSLHVENFSITSLHLSLLTKIICLHWETEMGCESWVPHLPRGQHLKTNHFPLHQHLPLEYWLSERRAAGPAFGYKMPSVPNFFKWRGFLSSYSQWCAGKNLFNNRRCVRGGWESQELLICAICQFGGVNTPIMADFNVMLLNLELIRDEQYFIFNPHPRTCLLIFFFKRKGKRNISQLPSTHSLSGDWTPNPGMYADQESNPQPMGPTNWATGQGKLSSICTTQIQ